MPRSIIYTVNEQQLLEKVENYQSWIFHGIDVFYVLSQRCEVYYSTEDSPVDTSTSLIRLKCLIRSRACTLTNALVCGVDRCGNTQK